MDTGVFIRANIGQKYESVDIGDPRLSNEELTRFLAGKSMDWLIGLILILLGRREGA